MDMLPKLTFIETLPFKDKVKEISFNEESGFSEIFQTSNEYSKITLKFESPLDKFAIIKISSDQDEAIEIVPGLDPVVIKKNTEDNKLVAGQYHFELKYCNKIYYSHYIVKSNILSNESVKYLRDFVDNMLNGLSKDFFYHKKDSSLNETSLPITLMQKYFDLSLQKKTIFFIFDSIFKNPILDLGNIYKKSNHSKRPDYKSLMWESKKGISNSNNSYSINIFNERRKEKIFNNLENQLLKKIIQKFSMDLNNLKKIIDLEVQKLDNEIQKLDFEKHQLEIEKEKIPNKNFGFEKAKSQIKYEQTVIFSKREKNNNKKKVYINHLTEIKKMLYRFNEYSNTEWFKSISSKNNFFISQRILKDNRYKKILDIYNKINSDNNLNKKNLVDNRGNKKTWKLFEYYNVGIVIKILIELGFEWTSGWLADDDNNNKYLGSLPTGTVMRFEKNDDRSFYIELKYDAESTLDANGKSGYFSENNRRPDILLSLYNSNDELLTDKSGLIIESKCRNIDNFFNKNFQTDVSAQLRDFKNMRYFNSRLLKEGKTAVCDPIFQVIVLYPKQTVKEDILRDNVYGNGIVYIQVQPTEIGFEESTIGYKNLKNMVGSFIEQALEGS